MTRTYARHLGQFHPPLRATGPRVEVLPAGGDRPTKLAPLDKTRSAILPSAAVARLKFMNEWSLE